MTQQNTNRIQRLKRFVELVLGYGSDAKEFLNQAILERRKAILELLTSDDQLYIIDIVNQHLNRTIIVQTPWQVEYKKLLTIDLSKETNENSLHRTKILSYKIEKNSQWNLPKTKPVDEGSEFFDNPVIIEAISENLAKPPREYETGIIVTLFGLSGVRKTAIASYFIHRLCNQYSMRVWFSAQTVTTLTTDYREFALEYLKPGMVTEEMVVNEKTSNDEMVRRVKKYFSNTENWFLVYDNALYYDDAPGDGESDYEYNLIDYLPNGNGYILVTSCRDNWPFKLDIDLMNFSKIDDRDYQISRLRRQTYEALQKQRQLEQQLHKSLCANHELEEKYTKLISRMEALEQSHQQLLATSGQPSKADKEYLVTVVSGLLRRQETITEFLQFSDADPLWKKADKAKQRVLLKNTTVIYDILLREIGQAQMELAKEVVQPPSPTSKGLSYEQRITQQALTVAITQITATRLRADVELLAQTTDRDTSRSSSFSCRTFQLPPPLPHVFVGREKLLSELNQTLQQHHCSVISQTIVGQGGIGKTQLANYYAQQAIQSKTLICYQVVLWFYAETEIGYQFKALAEIFCKLKNLPQEEAVAQVYRFLQDKVSLIIFDNAESLNILRAYLPPDQYLGKAHVIITTRQRQWDHFPILALPVFNEAETRQFIEERLKQPQDPELLKQLTIQLDGLPLALSQAVAYMQQMIDCKPDQRLARYLEQWRQNILSYELATDMHVQTVGVTVTLSLLNVTQRCPVAEVVLNAMAYLNPDVITLNILLDYLKGSQSRENVEDAIGVLLNYSLITSDKDKQQFSVHRLVQGSMWQRDQIRKVFFVQWEKIIQFLLTRMSKNERDLFFAKTYITHALFCVDSLERVEMPKSLTFLQEVYAELVDRIALFYIYGWREFALGRTYVNKAMKLFKAQRGDSHPIIASLLRQLGRACCELGDYPQAQKCCEQARAILHQHPNSDIELALVLNVSSEVERFRGQYLQATHYGERARNIFLAHPNYGSQHVWLAHVVNTLASIKNSTGDYLAAKTLYKQSLPIYQRYFGEDHPRMGILLANLAMTLGKLGDNEQAKSHYERALVLFRMHWGSCHPEVGWALAGLAEVFTNQGEIIKAKTLLEQALNIEAQSLNPRPRDIAVRLYNLANTCMRLQEFSSALRYAERVLEIYTKYFAETHPQKIQEARNLVRHCEVALHQNQKEDWSSENLANPKNRVEEKFSQIEYAKNQMFLNSLSFLPQKTFSLFSEETWPKAIEQLKVKLPINFTLETQRANKELTIRSPSEVKALEYLGNQIQEIFPHEINDWRIEDSQLVILTRASQSAVKLQAFLQRAILNKKVIEHHDTYGMY